MCPVKSYGQDTQFSQYVHSDIDLEDMTLSQGHDNSSGHGQQLCKILTKSNIKVASYDLVKDYSYLCSVTLTFDMTLVQGYSIPLGRGQQLCEILIYTDPT